MTARPRKPLTLPPTPEADVLRGVLALPRQFPGLALFRRNVVTLCNEQGRPVKAGIKGQADVTGWLTLDTPAGKVTRVVEIECKRGDYDPALLVSRKDQKPHEHFRRQLAWLKKVNGAGGLALWVTSDIQAATVINYVVSHPAARVEFDESGFPFLCH